MGNLISGASPDGETGSREPDPQAVPALSGFDPARRRFSALATAEDLELADETSVDEPSHFLLLKEAASWLRDLSWRPIETLCDAPHGVSLLGRRTTPDDGRQPVFVGERYDIRPACLLDPWSGRFARCTAWMPIPAIGMAPEGPRPKGADAEALPSPGRRHRPGAIAQTKEPK